MSVEVEQKSVEDLKAATQVVGHAMIHAAGVARLAATLDLRPGGTVQIPALPWGGGMKIKVEPPGKPAYVIEAIEYFYLVMPSWAAIGCMQEILELPITGVWDCATARAYAGRTGTLKVDPLGFALQLGFSKPLQDEVEAALLETAPTFLGLPVVPQLAPSELIPHLLIWFNAVRGSSFAPPPTPPGCALRLKPPPPPALGRFPFEAGLGPVEGAIMSMTEAGAASAGSGLGRMAALCTTLFTGALLVGRMAER